MLKFCTNAKNAIATVGLAAGVLAAGVVPAQAVSHTQDGSHGSPEAACQKWAKEHTFVWIAKAMGSPKVGLTVIGETLRVHCGGPDDFQYLRSKPFTGHLLPTGTIDVLVYGNSGPRDARLPESKFSYWVATDRNGNTYEVTGSFKAIRALSENYIP
jgi:hypothetical protein